LAIQAAGSTTLGVGEVFPTSFGTREVPGGPKALSSGEVRRQVEADVRFVGRLA
jgi:hypothetical protein